MTKGRFARLRELLDALLEAAPADPAAWLGEHYPGDAGLHPQVLAAHEVTRTSLPQPPETRFFAEAGPGAPAFDAQALVGTDIAGRFALQQVLGSGGSGTVFQAEDSITGDSRAVKVFHAAALGAVVDPRREAAALRLLRLPGVVQLHEDGIDAVGPYLVMDLVSGRPFPGADGPLAWVRLRSLALTLLEVLGRVHWAGLVHGDLKPSNILVDGDGQPHVLDLGIARALDDLDARPLAGTPRYLAPELLTGRHPDVRSDLFAVGVLLADALGWPEGHPPADHVAPENVVHMVQALLARDPESRPSSAAEALAGLRGGVADHHAAARARLAPLASLADEGARRDLVATLFAGPERWFHIPSIGAEQLLAEAPPVPEALLERLDAWERARFGRWEGDRFHIDRAGLARAKWAVYSTPRPATATEARPATRDALRLLVLLYLAPGPVEDPTAGAVLDLDPERVRDARRELTNGPWLPAPSGDQAGLWRLPPEARQAIDDEGPDLRARIADHLAPGDPLRLVLLSSPAHLGRVPRAAVDVASHALEISSDADTGHWACDVGLRALGRHAEPSTQARLLELLLGITISRGSAVGTDLLLRRLASIPVEPATEIIERLARAMEQGTRRDNARALAIAPEIAQAPTPLLRRLVASVRLRCARLDPLVLQQEGAKLERAVAAGHRELARYVTSTRAWLAQAAGRHLERAELQMQLAREVTAPQAKLLALESASSAFLDAGEFERARRALDEAKEVAGDLREPGAEANAFEQARHIAYRAREPLEPDPDAVRTATHFAGRSKMASIAMAEAEISWRAGRLALARELVDEAVRTWSTSGASPWPLAARALQAALPPGVAHADVQALACQILASTDAETVVCAGGLLARVPGAPREELMEAVRRRAPEIRAPHDMPLLVISISEALQGW